MAVTFDVSDVKIEAFPAQLKAVDAGAAILKRAVPEDGMRPLADGTPLDRKLHVVTVGDEHEGEDERFTEAMRTARHIGDSQCDVELTTSDRLDNVRAHLKDTADGLCLTSVEGDVQVGVRARSFPRGGSPYAPTTLPAILTHGTMLTFGGLWKMVVRGAVPTRAPTVEAFGTSTTTTTSVFPARNGFIDAIYRSFESHVPLTLSPDHVWLVLAQGFATHVKQNAEELRARFVPFDGKKNIVVRRDAGFMPGNADNDWSGVVDELAQQLGEHVGEARKRLVVNNFSTTTNVERIASSITLLDAMSPFFTYELMTLCGIPRITLLGTVDDWRDVYTRARALCEFVDGWWSELGPALAHFVNAASGNVDVDVWRSFYKYEDRSGGATVSGWVNALFPYLEPTAGQFTRRDARHDTVKHGQHPWAVSSAPLLWSVLGQEALPMRLISGMPGFSLVDGAVQPAVAWAVLRDG